MGKATLISDSVNKKVYGYTGGELPDGHNPIVDIDSSKREVIKILNEKGLWDWGDVIKFVTENDYLPNETNYSRMKPNAKQKKIIKFIHRNISERFEGKSMQEAYDFIGKYKSKAERNYREQQEEKDERYSTFIEQQF